MKWHNTKLKRNILVALVAVGLVAIPHTIHAGVFTSIGATILDIAGFFAGIAGLLLNLTITYLIVGMGDLVSGTGIGNGIDTTWAILRDVSNIIFIFGLIYIGFVTILNLETANTKRMLVSIIIAALLINFSLFFSKLIIDVSNVMAVEIYQSFRLEEANSVNHGIAGRFMSAMGIGTIYNNDSETLINALTAGGNVAFFFAGMVVLLVTAFVFAAGAVLITIRFVALILLMIFSPIMFAAMVFPKTQSFAAELWKKLLGYAFFAPAYLFMLFISLQMLNSIKFDGRITGEFAEAFANTKLDAFNVVLNFVIAIVFLSASLMVAQKMGIRGGEATVSLGSRIARGTGRGMLRGGLYPARASGRWAGRLGSRIARRMELSERGTVLKRLPWVTPTLQVAGRYAKDDLNQKVDSLAHLRSKQVHQLLDTYMAKEATPLVMRDTLAAYERINKNGDIDELSPEQIQHYLKLRKQYGLGSKDIHMQRPDAVGDITTKDGIDEMRKAIHRFKFRGDFAKMHRIVVALSGKEAGITAERGTPEYEQQVAKREATLDMMAQIFHEEMNAEVFKDMVQRQSEHTKYLKEWRDAEMEKDAGFHTFIAEKLGVQKDDVDTNRATHLSAYFEYLASKQTDPDTRDRNLAVADYVLTAPAIRAMGLQSEEEVNREKRRERGRGGDGMDEDAAEETDAAAADEEDK